MPLPLIPIVIGAASLIAGATGVKKAIDAKDDMDEARRIGERAESRHRKAIDRLDARRKAVNEHLARLGKDKLELFKHAAGETIAWVEKLNPERTAQTTAEFTDANLGQAQRDEARSLGHDLAQLVDFESGLGAAGALGSGALTALGAYGTVGALGTASTGTAIASLSGAAATNATLAWLGGGSLAAGGLGIAGGTWVLGGVVAGPALAITGFMLASKAEKALTEATAYEAEVDRKIAEIDHLRTELDAIDTNVDEARMALDRLGTAFDAALAKMQTERDLRQRQEILLPMLIGIMKTIKTLVRETPLLDKEGKAVTGFAAEVRKLTVHVTSGAA
jgi:hypothetical protein